MTQAPAGWHPDPWFPGSPGALRYWDGGSWTGHTTYLPPITVAPRPQQATTTPDGQPLATWGERAAAAVIDGVILNVLLLAVWVPAAISQADEIRDWFDALGRLDPEGNDPFPRLPDLFNPTTALPWELWGITVLIGLLYVLGFWRWKQATPGKLAMGLRIRRREPPGDFPWSAMGIRYLVTTGIGVTGLAILDYLWPLWDEHRQALHDKVAGTNVVSVRRPKQQVEPVGTPTATGPPPRW